MTIKRDKTRPFARRQLRLESLEARHLMATFGVPWPEPRSLSVSFPSDNANVGAWPNELRSSLDQATDRLQWQHEVLRAFQTWASVSNINIGLVPDRGDDFGTVGLTQNDPRFGEFRVGAFPQGVTLANATPFDQRSGTWSGDVLLNTETNYFLGDWNSTGPITVPAPNERGPAIELFSVLLHEAGNALGLADNNLAGAVMNGSYSGPNGRLKASDVVAIRQLYGARVDPFEPISNNALVSATPIRYPAGFTGNAPIARQGTLNFSGDVDVYRFAPLPGREKVTVRLMAAGISLLKARLEVLDRFGTKIADVGADSIFNNNLQLEIGSLAANPLYYVRVMRNSTDVFSVGDYRLELDYRPADQQPTIVPPIFDADADDDDDQTPLIPVNVDALFAGVGILDAEVGTNDNLATALPISSTLGYLPNSRYEVVSSLSSAADRDLWRLTTPTYASPTMTVGVDPVGLSNPIVDAYVLNDRGDRLAARVTRKADGGRTLAISNPGVARSLILYVKVASTSTVASGNYVATVDFATEPAVQLQNVYSAGVTPTSEHYIQLNVLKTQLMRFDLFASGSQAYSGVQLTFYNARTGDIEGTLASRVGGTSTAYLWLSQGSYFIRATFRSRTGVSTAPVNLRLRTDVLSDDQGPRPSDPNTLPDPNVSTEFEITNIDQTNPPPIIDYLDPTVETPWNSDAYEAYLREFFGQTIA